MSDTEARFFSASDDRVKRALEGGEPIDERTQRSFQVNQAVKNLASVIEANVPDGRNKSIALTDLESVQMRSNRGIFAPSTGAR